MPEIHVLHVHPDPEVAVVRRIYTFNCTPSNADCDVRGASKLSCGFGGPWKVLGRQDAWPVLLDGKEIGNPFDSNLSISIGNACAKYYKRAYVIQYDYIDTSYRVSVETNKEYYNGYVEKITPGESYAVFPHIIGYEGGNPIWQTELDINEGVYCGATLPVKYGGSAGPAGLALDYRNITGWYTEIRTFIDTKSKIMIGKQKQYGGTTSQQRHYTDGDKQIPYRITGPSRRFADIASNINIQMIARQPAPIVPGPQQWGTVIVTTWHGEGYLVGADIYSMNYGPTENTYNGALGQSRCSFVSKVTTHSLLAIAVKGPLLLVGNGNVTVEPYKAVELTIQMQEFYCSDHKIETFVEVEALKSNGDVITGLTSIDTYLTIKYPTGEAGDIARSGMATWTEVTTKTVGTATKCVGLQATASMQIISGTAVASNAIVRLAMLVGNTIIFQEQPDILSITKVGGLDISSANNVLAYMAQNAYTINQTFTGWLASTEGVNNHAFIIGLDMPSNPVDNPVDIPDDWTDYITPKDKNVPHNNPNQPNDTDPNGPIEPYARCIETIYPGVTETIDTIPELPKTEPIVVPDEPIPVEEVVFSYILESQAMVLGTTKPTVYKLYAFTGVLSGKNGDIVKVGYSRNVHDVEGYKYKANSPLGILCLNVRGEAVTSGATIVNDTIIEIKIGVAEPNSRYILMGEFESNYIPPATGRFICKVKPDVDATIRVLSFVGNTEVEVYSATGPAIDINIIPGNYTVRASFPGYSNPTEDFTVIGGEETSIILVLVPNTVIRKFISFNIVSTYSKSTLKINGRTMGIQTPCSYGVSISRYTVFNFEATIVKDGIVYTGFVVIAVDLYSDSYYNVTIDQIYSRINS